MDLFENFTNGSHYTDLISQNLTHYHFMKRKALFEYSVSSKHG